MIKITGADIPERLREIPQPPKQLYIEGKLPSFEEYKFLTVVGSRRFTNYGQSACQKIVAGLNGYPIVIVSGLALGIDAIAHKMALEANLKTVALPGSGLDESVIAPKSNLPLARKILQAGGALVSEFEPKIASASYMFPQRNRLMAGLADAVLIIEAEEQSGTLITARLATEYNRTLLVVPGSIFSSASKGANRLLKQGATPACSSEDVLTELGFAPKPASSLQHSILRSSSVELSDLEQRIINMVAIPMSRDDIIRGLGLPVHECMTALMAMEIKGLIKESMGEFHRA